MCSQTLIKIVSKLKELVNINERKVWRKDDSSLIELWIGQQTQKKRTCPWANWTAIREASCWTQSQSRTSVWTILAVIVTLHVLSSACGWEAWGPCYVKREETAVLPLQSHCVGSSSYELNSEHWWNVRKPFRGLMVSFSCQFRISWQEFLNPKSDQLQVCLWGI